jgi:diguanylate cyclase (GGDEF)-like protein
VAEAERIPVPFAALSDMLGTATVMSRSSEGVALRWTCGCESRRDPPDGPIAFWKPCSAHVDAFLDRHTARMREAGTSTRPARNYPSLERWRRSFAALLAVVGSICIIDVIVMLQQRFEQVENDSIVDPLTGLYNRRGWQRRSLEESKRLERQPEGTVVFVMDLDDLKIINDRDGHAAGDAALVRVAQVIMSATRQHDVASRLGGDEFGLLATVTGERDADAIEQRLRHGFAECGLSVSLGRAHGTPRATVDQAIEIADREMYEDKRAKKALRLRHAS